MGKKKKPFQVGSDRSLSQNTECVMQNRCLRSMLELHLCFLEYLNCLKHARKQHARVMIPQGID